mgnify:CR=1 FL=1
MWTCRCCQLLVQGPAALQVFDSALPTPGLQAHTCISRFVDHLLCDRQEQINARFEVHAPRSTLAAWGGQTGAQLMPLYDALPECSCWACASSTPTRRRLRCLTLAVARPDAPHVGIFVKSEREVPPEVQRQCHRLQPAQHAELAAGVAQALEDHRALAPQHIDLHPRATPGGGQVVEAERAPQLPQRPHIASAAAAAKLRPANRLPARVASRPRARCKAAISLSTSSPGSSRSAAGNSAARRRVVEGRCRCAAGASSTCPWLDGREAPGLVTVRKELRGPGRKVQSGGVELG